MSEGILSKENAQLNLRIQSKKPKLINISKTDYKDMSDGKWDRDQRKDHDDVAL